MSLLKANFIKTFQHHWRSFTLRKEKLTVLTNAMGTTLSLNEAHRALVEIKGMKEELALIEKSVVSKYPELETIGKR
ncbi:hypothetical protein A1QO_02605 [Vibrio genomosp. F10 str. ZF-129]|uniref:Uncharacterized protein n=1 Tax=Vibrio genomosp. F10 str. ZF-129 TaxID=1187848 RepID=A0A1E5BK55_9VIBR|nr:hypothetical protein [Vibrio genomosp. F10]OEE38288.1 hypothetical protein A1QO_02605 [Vibrio genomosp. F10 str. ZF-129]